MSPESGRVPTLRSLAMVASALALAALAWWLAEHGSERLGLTGYWPLIHVAAVLAALSLLERILARIHHA